MLKKLLCVLCVLCGLAPAGQAEPFRGESCATCHAKIRDAKPAELGKAVDGGSYDAIVIGAGVSGLTAAHFLKDAKVLVLEKEDKVGGRIRRESLHAGYTPVAAVYTNKAYGAIAALESDLGISYQKIPLQNSLFLSTGAYLHDWLGAGIDQLPISEDSKAKFKKLNAELRNLAATESLAIPVENSKNGPLKLYDRVAFSKYLEDLYGPEVARMGDLFARDLFGITSGELSAFAGLLYLEGELEETYSAEGGLGVISEALGKELKDSVRTGAFVWSVSQDSDAVKVSFDRGGKTYVATAKAAVFAVPAMVTRRVAADLSAPKKRALGAVRYSSYAVVPMSVNRTLLSESFVLWNASAFFTDLTFPPPSAGREGQVVVAYVPYGGEPGRRRLFAASDASIKSRVLADLDRMFPGASAEVADISVIRWGHAMPVPAPDYMTKVRPVLARPECRYFFAGVDTQLPCLEGAVYSGYLAAQRTRRFLGLPDLPAETR